MPSAAQEAPIVHSVDRPGMVTRVLPPDYPAEALAKGVTGSVLVDGTIDRNDRLRNARLVAEGETPAVFVGAVKEALHHWRFAAPFDERCAPVEAPYVTRVWFEIDAGKPKISIERPAPARAAREQQPVDPKLLRPIKRESPRYPRRMIQHDEEGTIHARMVVEPDGKVGAVETTTFPEHRHIERRMLMREVERALGLWIYPAMPEGSTRKRIICMTVQFNLVD